MGEQIFSFSKTATLVRIDGAVKLLDTGLVRRLRRCAIDAQELECMSLN